MTFFDWLKFDEGCWNYQIILVHSKEVTILPLGQKRMAN